MGLLKNNEKELLEKDVEKRGLFLFFDIYFSRFFKFASVNLLMLGVNVFYIALLFFISPINANTFSGFINYGSVSLEVNFDMFIRLAFAVMIIIFWGGGPTSAGIAYIFRCYSAREHSWILSDFRDKALENIGQSLVIMVVDVISLFILPLAFKFYWAKYIQTSSQIFLVFIGILIVFTVIYTFMHYYMYQMMVRFECKIKDIYKNALILTMIKLPMLILLTIIGFALFFIPLYFLETYSFLVYGILLMALIRFIFEFYASRVIEDTIEPEAGKEKVIDHDRKWHK